MTDIVVEVEPGLPVHVQVEGDGPALVLVSAGAPNEWWAAQLRSFAATHTVVAFDYRRPDGWTQPPVLRDWIAMAEHVVTVLDSLGIQRASLEGVSGGALTACFVAARHPERVDALVLTNPAGPRDIAASRADDPRLRVFVDTDYLLTLTPDAMLDEFCAAVFSSEFAAANRELGRRLLLPDGVVARRTPYDQQPAFADGAAISAPTLVVAGGADLVTPPSDAYELAALIPHAETLVLDGATHALIVEQPERHDELVQRFLARTRTPAGGPS